MTAARSLVTPEAKALGIKMGVPLFKIRNLVERHNIIVLSSNYTLYGDMSSRVVEALKQFSSNVEVYSIDEVFLELPDTLEDELVQQGKKIKSTVKQWTGIPISIGISTTKVLSKIAHQFTKELINSLRQRHCGLPRRGWKDRGGSRAKCDRPLVQSCAELQPELSYQRQ